MPEGTAGLLGATAAPSPGVLAGGGELGALMRAHDWAATPLGPPENWPRSLGTAVRIMLTSRQPIWIGWGPDLTYLYNDPYKAIIGGKHPWALGRPTAEVWREIWGDIGPMLATAMGGVEGTYAQEQLLIMERNGYPEETYYTFSYSPIPDDDGRPGGIICANGDDTSRVVGERQLRLLADLSARTRDLRTLREALAGIEAALGLDDLDLPFALLFLAEEGGLRLAAAAGIGRDHPAAAPGRWPLDAVRGEGQVAADLAERFPGGLPAGAWARTPGGAPRAAAILPLGGGGTGGEGVLVVGLNPFRVLDDGYRGFLDLVASGVGGAVSAARGFEDGTRRAEALAEIDRAKTLFFSNVSHEFRTPLTLMLGPIEEALADPALGADARGLVELAHRNAQRLLKLVNALLDFTRIEAGRVEPVFQPTDLASLTADLALSYEATMRRAGLALAVDCPVLDGPVHVDPGLWEKVVLNLVSNAFKFTFAGGVAVSLRREGEEAVLVVQDTGVGIPAQELPRLFERFHRIEGQQSRSFEGSGIGLALVREIVNLHGGRIDVDSTPGRGTAIRVALPLGTAHLPPDALSPDALSPEALGPNAPGDAAPHPSGRASAFVAEAEGWLPDPADAFLRDGTADGVPRPEALHGPDGRPARIVVADDNADLRAYLARLLRGRLDVELVANGHEALAAIRAQRPDLLLSDVMMPGMDGFALLREVRSDPGLRDLPVILLSARAGEEARVEGLDAGADDYLTKPFSGRELVARLRANLHLARVRDDASRLLRGVAARQAFLVDLGDALRDLVDPGEIMGAAAAMLGRHLGAARCGYAETEDDGARAVVAADWTDGRLPSAAGAHPTRGYGAAVLAGLRRGETMILPDVAADPRLQGDERAAYESFGIGAVIGVPLVKAGHWAGALFVHEPERRRWTPAETDLVREVAERTWAAVEAARVQASLRESEARFRNMADHAPVMIWTTTPQGVCTYLNRRWYEFTGQTEDEAMGFGWLDATHPDDATEAERVFLDANAAQRPFRIEYRLRRADGSYAWAIDAAAPRLAPDGRFLGYVGSVIDISDRKRAEERQSLLVHELNHRVKNTLATVQSLAAQSFRLGQVDPAVREAFEARLLLLARAHDVLTEESWQGAGMGEIAARALAPFGAEDGSGRFALKGPAVRLPPRAALAIAMALHELATNAVKYGALSTPEGRVVLTWAVAAKMGEVAPRRLSLAWAEEGGPAVRPPERRGFGSRLIEGSLAADLGGEAQIEFRATGIVCRMVAPLSEEEPA